MKILDIHTHHTAPYTRGVVNLTYTNKDIDFEANKGVEQMYSVGIHPWETISEPSEQQWSWLEATAQKPEIVAIGESGVDLTPRGGAMFRQLQVFKRQIEISESVGKPMIIHNVKGDDVIIGIHRDIKPKQNWAIHGFRRKPQIAEMLLRAGFYLSFGENFNPETIQRIPADRILAETDESSLTIEEIIGKLSAARDEDLTDIIAANTARFLGL